MLGDITRIARDTGYQPAYDTERAVADASSLGCALATNVGTTVNPPEALLTMRLPAPRYLGRLHR